MKKLSIRNIWLALLLPILLIGQELIYLEQNIETSGMEMEQPLNAPTKSWISENKVRIEQPGQVMLLLFDEKKVKTLMTKEKQYVVMSFEEMDKILNLSNMLMQATNQKEIIFKKTGEEKKINKWIAYQVKSETETGSLEIWLSESVKMDRTAMIQMYQKMPGMSALVSSMEKSMEFPGFPVLTNVEMEMMGMEIKTSIELIKAEKRDFSDELFEIPKGYKEIDNPLKMLEEN